MINLLDEENLFKINPDAEVSLKTIPIDGGRDLKYVEVKNFYKNPEDIRDLLLSAPHHLGSPALNSSVPMWRSTFDGDIRHVILYAVDLVQQHLDPKYDSNKLVRGAFKHCANRISTNLVVGCPNLHMKKVEHEMNLKINTLDPYGTYRLHENPHVDNHKYAVNVWFSDSDRSSGGTAFYQHRESGFNYLTDMFQHLVGKDEEYCNEFYESFALERKSVHSKTADDRLFKGNKNWKLNHVLEIEFNSLHLYDGNYWHTAFLEEDTFIDYYRLAQIFFLPKPQTKVLTLNEVSKNIFYSMNKLYRGDKSIGRGSLMTPSTTNRDILKKGKFRANGRSGTNRIFKKNNDS